MTVLRKIWGEFWGPRMAYVLQNTLFTLMSTPGTTLGDVRTVLLDASFRRKILANVTDDQVKEFWAREFDRWRPEFRQEVLSPILNKIGHFLTNPLLRGVLVQPQSAFNLRQIMDTRKIFIANLSKGRPGDDGSTLLGSMLRSAGTDKRRREE